MDTIRHRAAVIGGILMVGVCAGCGTVCKTVGVTVNIAGHVTKTSLNLATTAAGAAVNVSSKTVRAGFDVADHAARKPAVVKAAASASGAPAVITTVAIVAAHAR